ncbi:MAG TPA: hypothetical protein VIP51_05535, partial [Eoetvoesiella sp.]
MTYSFATLDISRRAYDEIARKLRAAGYEHAFLENGLIDMHGIGLQPSSQEGEPREINGSKYIAVPIQDITTPRRGATVYTDMWWAVTHDHCVLFYTGGRATQRSPQCNVDR